MISSKLSTVARSIPASPIRFLIPFALEANARGRHIYHLNIGDPDVKSPEAMLNALKNLKNNPIGYAHSQGYAPLIEALLGYYPTVAEMKVPLTNENVQITIGGSEGLLWSLLATCEPDDEVLVFEPFYANYKSFAILSRAKLVAVKTKIEDGFHLPDEATIESAITSRTRVILFSNPSNPTGTVYTRTELEMLVRIAKKHHLYVISDEVYREFSYEGKKAISMLEYAHEIPDQIIIADSFSKRYSLCGIRIGCLISYNAEIMTAFLRFGQARLSAGMVDQIVAAELSKVPRSYFEDVNKEYENRRNVLIKGLNLIPGVTCMTPEGAFYAIAKLPVENATDFAKWLLTDFSLQSTSPTFHSLEKETVMVAPAGGFYATEGAGRDEIRIAYVLNSNDLERSIEILKAGLETYNNRK